MSSYFESIENIFYTKKEYFFQKKKKHSYERKKSMYIFITKTKLTDKNYLKKYFSFVYVF